MGHLVVMDDNPAELALSQTSLDLWHTWAPHMDAGCAFTPCGTLWLAANDAELQAAHDKRSTLQATRNRLRHARRGRPVPRRTRTAPRSGGCAQGAGG